MTILYSNGCSYTANFGLERDNRYPVLIANYFGWTVEDRAIPGSCNSKIIRSSMRDCINLLERKEPIVALIQLTHRERFEYAGTPTKENHWKYGGLSHDNLEIDPKIHDEYESVSPLDEKNWPSEIVSYAKQSIALQKITALNSDLLCSVVGLSSFF